MLGQAGAEKMPHVDAALGILSGSAPTHVHRRAAIRNSWLNFERRSLEVRFVVRCGGGGSSSKQLLEEAKPYPSDMLCTPLGEHSRTRGTISVLVYWMRHALSAFPSARFVLKADDDVFLHTPDLESHLQAIPADAAAHAYYGSIKYFHAVTATSRMELRAFAPTYSYALMVARTQRLHEVACGSQRDNQTAASPSALFTSAASTCRVLGPFPYACGQAFALGAALARALLSHPALEVELARVATLAASNPLVTEDGWLGAVIFRCFAASALPINLFTLGEPHLFIDDATYDLKATRALVIFHNRNLNPNPRPRWYERMRTLFRFSKVAHCTATTGWRPKPSRCCRARARGGQTDALSVRVPHWPVYRLAARHCEGGHAHARIDLGDAAVLRQWNVSS